MSGPQKGAIQINRPALSCATTALLALLARHGADLKPQHGAELLRKTLLVYFQHSRGGLRPNQVVWETKELAAMKVGDKVQFEADCKKSVWRSRVKTARKLLEEPLAAWQVDLFGPAYEVTRLPNGTSPRKWKPPALQAVALANIPLHGYTFFDWKRFDFAWKTTARRILDEPEAQWKSATTTRGLKITRVR